jgi:hypothetical protein
MQWQNPNGSLTKGLVIEDGAGNKLGTTANPLNVTGISGGGGSGSNASVGTTGATAPASATALGYQNASGNLTLPTPTAGLPVADSGAAITGAAMPAGGAGLSGWLSAIWTKLSGTLAVSAASLPLPTGAAQEAGGNLASLTTAHGGVADTAYVSGSGSVIAVLKGIFGKLAGTLAVSASSLALPAGAATAALQSSIITALGSPFQAGGSVTNANPAAIYSAAQTASLSAAALPSQALVNGVILTANAANTGTIYIGPAGVSTSTGYPLAAGQSLSYAVQNLSAISMIGVNTTDVLNFTGN